MSDRGEMRPLLDSDMPDDLARVLRSARIDGPPENDPVEARTLAAVAAHHAAMSTPGKRRERAGMPFAKTMLGLFVVGVGAASLVAMRSTVGVSHRAEPTPPSMPSAPLQEPAQPSAPTSPSSPGVSVDDLPSAPAEETPAKTAPSRSTRRIASDLDIEDELAVIDAARAALAAKRPEVTLKQVHVYARRFQGGHFLEEAQALEIQALAAMGRRDEATAKGQGFLATHPGSAYERRVRSALTALGSLEPGAGEVTP